jgi:Putative glucoamylase
VVTPHASFLGLRWDRSALPTNVDNLRRDFNIYPKWGFRDSVNVQTGVVSPFYLSLDQGMIMAAIGNELSGDLLRRAFAGPDMEQLVRPVISVERFNDTR